MKLNFHIHYYAGHNPDNKNRLYAVLSYTAWVAAIVFFCSYGKSYYGIPTLLIVLRCIIPLLFIQPIYTVGKSLMKQWGNNEIYVWDVFIFLFYIAVAVLVAINEFYLRMKWLYWLFPDA